MSQKRGSSLNSKSSKKKKSRSSLRKNSIRKSKSLPPKLSRKPHKPGYEKKITDERKPFVFQRRATGDSCQKIADAFGEEYEKIDQSSINHFLRDHPEEYQSWLQSNIKEDIRLANAKARILSCQKIADKLSESILDIIEDVPKGQWDEINLPALIKQYRELLVQIQDESGDKVHKFKAEGITGDLVFGDKVINAFADKTVQARVKETTDPGNRFKKAGFSDFGNSLSDN